MLGASVYPSMSLLPPSCPPFLFLFLLTSSHSPFLPFCLSSCLHFPHTPFFNGAEERHKEKRKEETTLEEGRGRNIESQKDRENGGWVDGRAAECGRNPHPRIRAAKRAPLISSERHAICGGHGGPWPTHYQPGDNPPGP